MLDDADDSLLFANFCWPGGSREQRQPFRQLPGIAIRPEHQRIHQPSDRDDMPPIQVTAREIQPGQYRVDKEQDGPRRQHNAAAANSRNSSNTNNGRDLNHASR